ncbi:hypothetical protein K488DRAFT_70476 [Vararia minispora EC-137]|uniref:Uncharacterized protein n=1 Tax=Vararia minispora EC-137 TaxID=1314806 RepID=A0ACB8QLV5_9AGAM|nr:hypothetical protein K488DRAFT_70476 [Vararia minispora EC-137]
MASLGRGYALWDPQPVQRQNDREASDPPVCIGDVGFIKDGKWQHLFNIHRAADEQQGIPKLPDDFKPVPLGRGDPQIVERGPQLLSSSTSSSTKVGIDGEGPLFNAQGPSFQISFNSTASLAYFGHSECYTTARTRFYTSYAVQHHAQWAQLVDTLNEEGYDLDLKQLVLVYECTRVPVWITNVVLGKERSANLGATVNATYVGTSVSLSVSFTKSTGDVDYSFGPFSRLRDVRAPTGPGSKEDADRQDDAPRPQPYRLANLEDIQSPADQCIFVKGVRIGEVSFMDKLRYWKRRNVLAETGPGGSNADTGGHPEASNASGSGEPGACDPAGSGGRGYVSHSSAPFEADDEGLDMDIDDKQTQSSSDDLPGISAASGVGTLRMLCDPSLSHE